MSEFKLEALQKIHTLYVEMPDYNMAEKYKQQIIKEFPESFYAKMLSDPSYIQKIKKENDEIEILYQTAGRCSLPLISFSTFRPGFQG